MQENIKNPQTPQDDEKFASITANDYMNELPSFMAKATLYLMLLLLVAAFIWSIFGFSDVVVSAKGVLSPSGEIKKIYADKSGTIMEIMAKAGDKINAGDPLIKLNSSSNADTATQMKKLQEEIEVKTQELSTKKASLDVAHSSLRRTKEQYEIRKKMYENSLISKIELLKEEDGFDKAKGRIEELETAVEGSKVALNDAKRKYALVELEYKKIDARSLGANVDYDIIRADMSGVVSKSEIKYANDFIKAGDVLFEIVPDQKGLVAKVEIPNTGIGRVKKGMKVKLKYDGYPYQQFGIGDGVLSYLPANSRVIDEKKQEFVYDGVVELNGTKLITKDGEYPLFAGLTMQAEIVVEQKRIIMFLVEMITGQK